MHNQGIFNSSVGNWLFVLGIPMAALHIGLFASTFNEWFELIFVANLWVLGYHHVIATYTRFESVSGSETRALLIKVPILIGIFVFTVYFAVGPIAIFTIYLYWQWFHYTRQSDGISRAIASKSQSKSICFDRFNRSLFYLASFCCFFWMCSRQGGTFLGQPYWVPHVGELVRFLVLVLGFVAIFIWVINIFRLKAPLEHIKFFFGYVFSHFLIYMCAYVYIDEFTYGWLVINIWHNAQYLAFVWLYNSRSSSRGDGPFTRLLYYLSRKSRWPIYFLFFLLVSTLLYKLIDFLIYQASASQVALWMATVYAVINFHHYVVDGRVWKLRRPIIQERLRLDV